MYRRREIAIDLTALLDVILIILFMFVVRSTNQVVNTSTESSEKDNNSQIVQLQEENTELKKQLDDLSKSLPPFLSSYFISLIPLISFLFPVKYPID